MPTMTPNSPSALPKISITRILTKRVEFCASDKAQLLPIIPTHSLCENISGIGKKGENQRREKCHFISNLKLEIKTETHPQTRFANPTMIPDANIA